MESGLLWCSPASPGVVRSLSVSKTREKIEHGRAARGGARWPPGPRKQPAGAARPHAAFCVAPAALKQGNEAPQPRGWRRRTERGADARTTQRGAPARRRSRRRALPAPPPPSVAARPVGGGRLAAGKRPCSLSGDRPPEAGRARHDRGLLNMVTWNLSQCVHTALQQCSCSIRCRQTLVAKPIWMARSRPAAATIARVCATPPAAEWAE